MPKKKNSATWYRVDKPDAPQGHALSRDLGESAFITYEQADGTWLTQRMDASGTESSPVVLPDFPTVRREVEKAVKAYKRTSNPNGRYVKTGVGALIGTVTGMLLGGLPGVAMNHASLTVLGSQVGGVIGAATGAVLGHERALKARLLR